MLWPFEYFCPKDRQEVAKLLVQSKNAAVLAGGTDLLVNMRGGIHRPDHVVDITKIEDLNELKFEKSGTSLIGASVNLNRVIEDKNLKWQCLRQSAQSIATYQIRNRATVVGNLCNASPAADCAPPLLVLEAAVRILGKDGKESSVPLEKFFTGVKTNCLKAGQWAVGVEIPQHPAAVRTSFMKKQRVRGHDLAIVNIAGCLNRDEKKLRIAVGSCAPTPLLFNFDKLYKGKSSLKALIKAVQDHVLAELRPISDNRGSAEYRADMVKLFLQRVMNEIFS